jgi:methionine-rich copper-binding protein CopC
VKRLLLVAALVALALPGTAWAHATLQTVSPNVGQRLAASPRAITLTFDQSVKTLPNGIRVYDAGGKLVSGEAHGVPGDPRAISVTLRKLPRGAYTVRWSAISNDSHVGHGLYTFGVRVAAPALSEAYGASGPTTAEHIVRWLYFICLALLTGGLGFRLFVLRGDITPAAERRDRRPRGRDRGVPAPRPGRAAASLHLVPVRRPVAVCERHPFR